MFEVELFLGYPLDLQFIKSIEALNPHLLATFVNNDSEYLHEIVHQQQRYFGKFVGACVEVAHLELLEANIISLLRKLIPNFSCQEAPLVLFTTAVRNHDG